MLRFLSFLSLQMSATNLIYLFHQPRKLNSSEQTPLIYPELCLAHRLTHTPQQSTLQLPAHYIWSSLGALLCPIWNHKDKGEVY